MAAITKASMVQRIRYELGDFPWEDPSCSAANATSTITGATTGKWVKGNVGEFVTDGDIFLTISETGGTITATRSYHGSTGASHSSERVLKEPRYFRVEILNAVEQIIQSLPYPRIYKKVADTITPTPASGTQWYDLAAAALDLIDVRQLYGTSDLKEGQYGLNRRFERQVQMRRNMTTTLAASGVGLNFPTGFYHPSNTVNVDYAARITDTGTASYDDLNEGDIVTEAVIFGAVAHLEEALENRKPRKPRQDRETLRGGALFRRKYEELLNLAEQELRETAPLLRK